jgi:hypothetical protein
MARHNRGIKHLTLFILIFIRISMVIVNLDGTSILSSFQSNLWNTHY